jgi:DNA-directed RNA polymerase III subunit RPC2
MTTRQPVEGRAREGGLRLGEMERDCAVAYGAAALLRERLLLASDAVRAPVCAQCGVLGTTCASCPNQQPVLVTMPYAFKLLLQGNAKRKRKRESCQFLNYIFFFFFFFLFC